MSRRGLWISSAFAVAIGAIAVFAFSARDRAVAPTPASVVQSSGASAARADVSGPAEASESSSGPLVGAAKEVRARQIMQWLARNERDEASRQIVITRVRPPLPDPEKQQQLEIDEAEAEREARSLGLADSDFVTDRRAELTATRSEDVDHFSRRVAAEERAMLADEYLTEYFVRRYLASTELPNGMPMEEIYRGMRSSVAGLTPEQRADSFQAARAEFGSLPSQPTYSAEPAQGWNHPSSPEGG